MPQPQPILDSKAVVILRVISRRKGISTVELYSRIVKALDFTATHPSSAFYRRTARLRAAGLAEWTRTSGWRITTRGTLVIEFLVGVQGAWQIIRSLEWPVEVDPPNEASGIITGIHHIGTLVTLSGFWLAWDDLAISKPFQLTLDAAGVRVITCNLDGSMTVEVMQDRICYIFAPASARSIPALPANPALPTY